MKKRKTLQEVIKNFKNKHGDKYDYSLIKEYNRVSEKLPIICHKKDENGNEHGVFYQSYCKHYTRGHGCPKCAKNGVQYSNEEFKEKIIKLYGDKYDVSKVDYVNAHTPVTFICNKHGEFTTKPYYLLQGHGCPLCGREILSEKMGFSQEEVLKAFENAHHDKYDYSEFVYNGYDVKSKIICHKKGRSGKEHGAFYQTPHVHMKHGCPICRQSKLEKEIYEFLQKNDVEFEIQKRFEWSKLYEYDFYLPKQNIIIECQGEQHFIPANFGSKKKNPEEMLKYVIERDIDKRTLAENNSIKVVYFTHYADGKSFYPNNLVYLNTDEIII